MHETLVKSIRSLNPPTPAAVWVLLHSYFEHIGLVDVENYLADRRIYPPMFKHQPAKVFGEIRSLDDGVRALQQKLVDPLSFGVTALWWLTLLDRELNTLSAATFELEAFHGFDGKRYALRRRNNFIATEIGSFRSPEQDAKVEPDRLTWQAQQSASLAAYATWHVAVPLDLISGRQIRPISREDWGNPYLHQRLLRERSRLRVLIWPFRSFIRYAALGQIGNRRDDHQFVRLDVITNEDEILAEALAAVEQARVTRATILLFPELAISERIERAIRAKLAEQGQDGHPLLTALGRTHRSIEGSALDDNEAVLLGSDGRILHVHCKLTRFSAGDLFSENTRQGKHLVILESDLGNIALPICLDLFNQSTASLLKISHGNVFLVPSLSPSTEPHRDAARSLANSQLASTFVCNRPLVPPADGDWAKCSSFFRVPRRGESLVAHLPEPVDPRFLLFRLEE